MSNKDQSNVSFQIGGDVTGGITGNIIAGRDATSGTISIGGQEVPVDKEPNFDEFKQLLAELQQEIAEVAGQQETLKEISAAAPFSAQGAEAVVKEVAEEVQPDADPEKAKSVQTKLKEATGTLGTLLDGAKTVAEKTGEVSGATTTLIEKLVPLVKKIGVAAIWVAKLWL
jgi:hypothetical protein